MKILGWNIFWVMVGLLCGVPLVLSASGIPHTKPYIRSFTPIDYNAQNQNWGITQSPEGYIYVANNAGLLEFDGSSWKLFYLPARQTPRSVTSDSRGRIYNGGFETFGFWSRNDGNELQFKELSKSSEYLIAKEEIWHIQQVHKGTIFQTFSTLFKYQGDQVQMIMPPGNVMFLNEINSSYYLQVIDGGIYEFKADNSFELLEGTEALSEVTVSFILPWNKKGLFIGTNNDGVYIYEDGQLNKWDNPINEQLEQFQLNKGISLRKGGFVLGTLLNGVYVFDAAGQLSYHLNKNSGLQNNTVLSLMEDRDYNVWVGLDKGIDVIELNNSLRYYFDQSGNVGAIYTAAIKDGYLYLGSNQGVYYSSLTDSNNQFQLIQGTQGQVWDLKDYGQLLCGHNKGTFRIEGNRAIQISDITGGWYSSLLPGRKDVIIQGTYSGLVRYRKDSDGFWQFDGRIEGFSEPVKKLYFDDRGYLWVAHPQKGISRLLLQEGLERIIEIKSYGPEQGLDNYYKTRLFSWNNQLAIKSDCVYTYRRERDDFQCIEEDRLGWHETGTWLNGADSLWFLSREGELWLGRGEELLQLLHVRLVQGFENIIYFPEWEGGTYFFCQENGFSVIGKEELLNQYELRDHSRLHIRCVSMVKNGQIMAGCLPENIKLEHRDNTLEFHFAMPSFDRAPMYSYRMTGFQDDWSVPGSTPQVRFQNLPPGQYTFELKSPPFADSISFEFYIREPWYKSTWAYLGYLLLAIGLIWGIYRYIGYRLELERQAFEQKRVEEARLRAEKESRERLEQEVSLKTRELAHSAMSQIRKNEVLSHIKTSLNEILKGNPKARHILSSIDEHIESDQDWDSFVEVFNNVHDDFFKKLQVSHPNLTPGDLKLAAYLRLNLSTKEIAPLLNLSVRSVENKRYRLRKKMDLSEEDNLTEYIMKI